jgi:uncharacterized protein YodC (DUF2158 family)
MHLSLKGSLDRQPLTDRLGDRLLAEYGGAAAAYSLRALNGNGDSVVRVRRASDNDEKDFTAEQIELGEMVNWVNSQTVPPLDIGVETSEGRIPVPEGGTSIGIPAAAYSLRNLSTTYTGNVVDVRRLTGGTESFTAAEVADGTLEDWVNTDYVKYSSDFTSNDNGWGSFDDVTETGAVDGIGGLDGNLRLAIGSATSQHRAYKTNILPENQKINFSARVFIPSTNSVVDGLQVLDAVGNTIINATSLTQDQWVTVTANDVTTTNSQLRVNLLDGSLTSFTGNSSDVVYLREITVTQVTSDGHVSKWYDQSGNDNHATQGTAASQPMIVNGGSLVSGGLEFDGFDDHLEQTLTLTHPVSIFSAYKALSNNSPITGSDLSSMAVARRGSGEYIMFSGTALATGVHPSTEVLASCIFDGATSTGHWNGVAILNGDVGSLSDLDFIGRNASNYLNGTINEIIIYDSDQSANRTAIEANIGETYGITGIPAYDNTVDGFVETWYDQSGNGNDATQLTANDQPRIVISGNLVTSSNGLPAIRVNALAESFDLDSNIALGNFSLFYTVEHTAFGSAVSWLSNNSGSTYMRYTPIAYNVDTGAIDNGYINLDATLATATNYLISAIRGSGIIELSVSGSVQSNTDSNSGTLSVQKMFQRGSNETQGLNGYAQELIIYPTDKTANRVAIETNINDHYNIY